MGTYCYLSVINNAVLVSEGLTDFNMQNLGGSQMAFLMDFYLRGQERTE